MSRLPRLSGEEVVKVLTSKFGFRVSRQRGSHVVLVKYENGCLILLEFQRMNLLRLLKIRR
ncbi:type II toxin-antitoxin system HicA family toxin [Thermococcus peptonophilus]|uniref:type II toxin-antitoxin system HicA family toxin n=1 Tax=Thermococcus peptonophilus TaxID=53952 RepID=UPI001E5984DB|nr:type II toxin-antitoxin system HicA family toxin [Thermococcus peptonophilus]